jgi:hypothetical protein
MALLKLAGMLREQDQQVNDAEATVMDATLQFQTPRKSANGGRYHDLRGERHRRLTDLPGNRLVGA